MTFGLRKADPTASGKGAGFDEAEDVEDSSEDSSSETDSSPSFDETGIYLRISAAACIMVSNDDKSNVCEFGFDSCRL